MDYLTDDERTSDIPGFNPDSHEKFRDKSFVNGQYKGFNGYLI